MTVIETDPGEAPESISFEPRQDRSVSSQNKTKSGGQLPSRGIDRFWKFIEPWQQIGLLLITLSGGALALHDYYATAFELEVMRCRAETRLLSLESDLAIARLSAELQSDAALLARISEGPANKARVTAASPEIVQKNLKIQGINEDLRLHRQNKFSADSQREAGVCEASVRDRRTNK